MEEKKQLQKEVTSSEMIKPLNQNQFHRQAFLLGQSIQAVQRTDEQQIQEVRNMEEEQKNIFEMADNSENVKKLTEGKPTIVLNGQLLTGESILSKEAVQRKC
ncbi:hypothetical protein [Leuconostoc mesenteroides]|uniref:hypothetical protein n=1 Tax=Leuconostoc mesenteroides TaxID=1245 RepID=UPI0023623684|nr:hypothetical protein [Leuconostoc mesenteroides]